MAVEHKVECLPVDAQPFAEQIHMLQRSTLMPAYQRDGLSSSETTVPNLARCVVGHLRVAML